MKRILGLLIILSMLIGSVAGLTSCDIIFGNDTGVFDDNLNNGDDSKEDNENGDTDNGDGNLGEEGGNTDIEGGNTDIEGGNTDSEGGNADNEGGNENNGCTSHIDENNNEYCDNCNEYVVVVLDFYVINDLHGKFCDSSTQPGVDELGTYFENMSEFDDNMILLSSGDMWQGGAESTLTYGQIMVDWMNTLGFVGMTLGNHEFDWGEQAIKDNLEIADFPFLAINIFNKCTGKLADYCTPSIMIERNGIQIGIIGAIGDCISSISSDMVEDVEFKVGSQLTSLVKNESERLRSLGADIIVYSLHSGEGDSSYYDSSLSNGYVDVVFEAHTHQSYMTIDSYGIYHLQAGGENHGLSHVEIKINSANGNKQVTDAGIIKNNVYGNLDDHEETEAIEDKYSEIIDFAYAEIGEVTIQQSDSEIEDFVAQLYLEAGIDKWGSEYDIVLGGGFLRTRTPYNLTAGIKTYADLLSLFPFNNDIVLCSISGSNLKSKFINTTNSDYHVALNDGYSSSNISNNGTYYIVVDTYTALYAPNKLTIVDIYDEGVYARDLLADAIRDGRLQVKANHISITEALNIGNSLSVGKYSEDVYYVTGVVKSIDNTTYGNIYITDESGKQLFIYGLYDLNGNRYDKMSEKPKVGDTITVRCTIYKYSASVVEMKSATLIEIN